MAGRHESYFWMTCFWCIILCFVLAMAILRQADAAEQPAWPAETLESFPPLEESPVGDEPMMVVSLDGGLHAVHPVTRKKLWSFASGPKLATMFEARREKESRDINASMDVPGDDDLGSGTEEWSIFPGPDGNLFIQDEGGIKPLPVTIKQLVDSSPHHTDDGAVILSSVTNTAFLLNKDTGALIRKFENSRGALEKAALLATRSAEDSELLLGSTSGPSSNPDGKVPTLLCLRTDYSVTIQEIATGNVKWNVSLGEVKTLPLIEPGHRGPSSISGVSEVSERGIIARPIPGTRMNIPRPAYRAAPIAIFSSTGDYISNLLPESTGPRRSLPTTPNEIVISGKPSDMHRMRPIPDESDNKQLVPVLARVGEESYAREEFSERTSYGNVEKQNNRSASHSRGNAKRVNARIGGLLLLVAGMLWSVWFFYSQFWCKKREDETVKSKKAGANKGRKKGRKGTSSGPAALNKGSGEEIINEVVGTKREDDTFEAPGKRRIAMDTSSYGEGIQVGRLFVTKVVIGAGSNGTTVFEGYLDGRSVAVKRLLAHHYDKAEKEIKFLITSDEHPNVVRYFAMEETPDFVYVALERCSLSLNDLIVSESARSPFHNFSGAEDSKDLKQLKMPVGKELKLWIENGRCSPQLLQLMRDIVAGLSHLHSVGIVHRDLKPHNVLVSSGRILQAKLADMGLSKHLDKDVSSYQDTGKGGSGSRGWQAPEQLMEGRQTRAVDIFSLGCVLFFCITGGQHPYGEHFLRDANIANGRPDLFYIEDMPEAHHLIQALLSHDPSKRPAARDVMLHPLFWNAEQRLSFLRDASDRVELEDREENSVVLSSIEAVGPTAFGASWETNLDADLLDNLRRYRRYNYNSVRDLLRIIRNKSNHYRELPQNVQELLGPVPEGYESYFAARFPRLLVEVYKVLYDHCKEERMFKRYFEISDV